MYGDHDYRWLATAVHPQPVMIIVGCTECSGSQEETHEPPSAP